MRSNATAVLAFAFAALTAAPLARAGMDDDIRQLQREWEEIKYRKPTAPNRQFGTA